MFYEIMSNVVITKVYSASTVYTPENATLKRKDRKQWALVIKYEGETLYSYQNKHFLSDLNHLVILPKGCSYDWRCTKAGHFSIIEFESGFTYDMPLCLPIKNGEKILKIFKDLEYRHNLNLPMNNMESIRDTYSIILSLSQSYSEKYLPSDKLQKVLPAVEYMSQNYTKNITNDTLAALTGMSTVYFRKLFTAVTGVSPIAYLHRLRIQKAKEMLKSDYGKLSDLARSLGYASLYDFSRDFKKHTGVAPSKY